MARSKDNLVIKGLTGKLGKQLVFSQRNGRTIVSKPPVRKGVLTEAQKAQHERFARASAYAKRAMADGDLKRSYAEEAKKHPDTSAYNMAMADYLRAPVISAIDYSGYDGSATGQKIFVEVGDAFKVTGVRVEIMDSDESTVEEGNATLREGKWEYQTTATNASLSDDKIIVTATDRPGNITKKEVVL